MTEHFIEEALTVLPKEKLQNLARIVSMVNKRHFWIFRRN